MERSETLSSLIPCLAKAQAAMDNPKFDAANPHFHSRYCSLAAIRDAVLPALTAHGLALVQPVSLEAEHVCCETTLLHESGEFLRTSLRLPLPKADAQTFAALATYAKRIALQALLCVAGDADDDEPPTPESGRVRDAVDTYTAAGLRERIDALLADQRVPPERHAAWWQEQVARHGDPLPVPVLRALYRRLREEARKRPRMPQEGTRPAEVTGESFATPRPTEAPPERQGAAWDTLRAHRTDPRLPEALRHRVQLVLTRTLPATELEVHALAGEVLDWLDATEEDPGE